MGIPVKSNAPKPDISLDDKYCAETGRIFLNGTQALVRLPMTQMRRDRAAGLNTATYISGYRGSPIGSYDLALQAARRHLAPLDIHFQPGLNEDLAATAIWGSQGLAASPGARKEGVLGIWYGKGPGVDRSGDVLRHANSFGSARHGGVLALAGDDHHAKSSTVAHQSDHAFMSALMPMLFPSSVHEFIELGLAGIAMSRYSGLWVAFKLIADTIDTSTVIDLAQEQRRFVLPEDFEMPPGGLNNRWPDDRFAQDERLQEYKGYAAIAFARANHLDEVVLDSRQARFGIIASGKAFENVMEALRELAIDAPLADAIGLRVYKVRMPWPLEPDGVRHFSEGLEEVLVIEERREVIEHQIKQQLFNWRADVRPRIVGKFDDQDRHILSLHEDITTGVAVRAIAARLLNFELPEGLRERITRRRETYRKLHALKVGHKQPVTRLPHFCAGCPHNTSTQVPEGSRAFAGIGCHFMSLWMDRRTETYTHMGGEGVTWLGMAPFTDEKHVFTNLGDGTYFHSGILAIRQSVAAGVNITYKLLFNSAVAMTGGQPLEGTLTVPQLAHQLVGEGVGRVVVVTDDTGKYSAMAAMPKGVAIHHRDAMDELQRGLREVPGVTALIFDQTCAAEKRRLRKKGKMVEPPKRVFINDEVCEACGDCSVQSNCVSVKPLETELGRKRQIDQSNCNKDYTCVSGFCPSFVTVSHAQPRKKQPVGGIPQDLIDRLPAPQAAPLQGTYNLLVTGIGGTGVLTIGALLGMAAHLEGKASSVLDFNGVAQKNGAVMSHVRLASDPDALTSTRLATGSADLLLGCDLVVSASPSAISRFSSERTHAVVNAHNTPTAAFILDGNVDFESEALREALEATVAQSHFVDATRIAEALLGDSIGANLFLVGFALQKGLLPLSAQAIERAIELNGVSVAMNQQALAWGRLAAHDPDALQRAIAAPQPVTPAQHMAFEDMLAHYAQRLQRYQNGAYAQAFTHFIRHVQAQENARIPGSDILTRTTATSLHKLMCYKDEYEVARLYTDGSFMKKLTERFEGAPTLQFHLAPPLWSRFNAKGEARKRAYGPWAFQAFRLLARMKGLRGTVLDPFGHTRERRSERALIGEFREKVDGLLALLDVDNLATAVEIAEVPQSIRGFGHVRERHLLEARQRWAALDAQWRAPRTTLRQAA